MIREEPWTMEYQRFVFVCDTCGAEKALLGTLRDGAAIYARTLRWQIEGDTVICPACREGDEWYHEARI